MVIAVLEGGRKSRQQRQRVSLEERRVPERDAELNRDWEGRGEEGAAKHETRERLQRWIAERHGVSNGIGDHQVEWL